MGAHMPTGPRSAMASELPTVRGATPPKPPDPPKQGPAAGTPAPGSGTGPVGTAPARMGSLASALPKACPTCQARYPADFKVCPRDASPLIDAADDGTDHFLGATLGDAYQIVRMVGEGGMGRVYEARHTRLGNKRFAIKMLH